MSTKGVSGSKLDWAPWAQLANEVQEVRQKVANAAHRAAHEGADVKQAATEATPLTKRMQEVLAKRPNLVGASPEALKDAATAALSLAAVATPLAALSRGLQGLDRFAAPEYITHRYAHLFQQLETVVLLRDAVAAAGDALSKFPKAQLDGLEEALKAELANIAEQRDDVVGSIRTTQLPPERVLGSEALELYQGLQDLLVTLGTTTPHEFFNDVAVRSFGDVQPMQYLRQTFGRTLGGRYDLPAGILPGLAARALTEGEPASKEDLVQALLDFAPDSAPWGDIVHAYLSAADSDLEVERRPRQKSAATLLVPAAMNTYNLLQQSGIRAALEEAGGLDLLAEASQARDGRALTGDEVLELAHGVAGDEPHVLASLNQIAMRSGLDPIIGLPKEILDLRNTVLSAVKAAGDTVGEIYGELGRLSTSIAARRQDVQGASQTAQRALASADPEAVPGIVEDAQTVFEAASKDAGAYRNELATMFGGVVEIVEALRDDLRSSQGALRKALAPLRGELDASPSANGFAQALDYLEKSLVGKVATADRSLNDIVGGANTNNARASLGAIETEIENALVNVVRLGARTTKTAEVRAEHLAATKAAEERRAAIAAEPLTIDRLLELPLDDLSAYQLHPNVTSVVAHVRRMNVSPEFANKVMSGWLQVEDGKASVRSERSPFAGAVDLALQMTQSVGMGTSPKQAIEWLDNNVGTFIDLQTNADDREAIMKFVDGLVSNLERMSRS